MIKIILLSISLFGIVNMYAQNNVALSTGAELLFNKTKTNLTAAEKNQIFDSLGVELSADRKRFAIEEDIDHPFDAIVTAEDLNKDGKEEIFIVYGNSFLGGNAGSVIALFIKNKEGKYRFNLGFPASDYAVLETNHLGYADLSFGLPGDKIPVWKWNGKKYEFYKSINPE